MFPIESQHVLVLTNEVIVELDFHFFREQMLIHIVFLIHFIYAALSNHHSIRLLWLLILTLVLDVHAILVVVYGSQSAVTTSFNGFAMVVVLLSQFFVVSIHQLSDKLFQPVSFIFHLAVA